MILYQTGKLGQGVQHVEISVGRMLKVACAKFPSGSSHCTSQWANGKTNQHINKQKPCPLFAVDVFVKRLVFWQRFEGRNP